MTCLHYIRGETFVHRLDPRVRVLAAVSFSVVTALLSRFDTLTAALVLAGGLAMAARIPMSAVMRRLKPVNLFMLVLILILPLTTPGQPIFAMGPLAASREGLLLALAITLKGNIIVLSLVVLLDTMDVVTLGHALQRLHVPAKLVHLFLFTVRYLEVVHHAEYDRLTRAMRVRSFQSGMNMHTYRSLGYLVGMLLVRSFDRSERILEAMKCRGFQGRFYTIDHFAACRSDFGFALGWAAAVLLLGWMQWG